MMEPTIEPRDAAPKVLKRPEIDRRRRLPKTIGKRDVF
jgi:hypothetical protein